MGLRFSHAQLGYGTNLPSLGHPTKNPSYHMTQAQRKRRGKRDVLGRKNRTSAAQSPYSSRAIVYINEKYLRLKTTHTKTEKGCNTLEKDQAPQDKAGMELPMKYP